MVAGDLDRLVAEGEEQLEALEPGDALFTWLRSYITHVASSPEPVIAAGGRRTPLTTEWHEAMHATVSALLTRAQRAGTVRADLTAPDLLTMANGIAVTGEGPEQRRRLLRMLRRGTSPG
ncbi:hypothetical protein [Spirillospora sp. NPDC047279]|uniref:SbtR family transcriptional regulator n=1 Tax=Spirillospora sp. NPDC047279 TaxID=3155478 RepID=UPI0033EE6647